MFKGICAGKGGEKETWLITLVYLIRLCVLINVIKSVREQPRGNNTAADGQLCLHSKYVACCAEKSSGKKLAPRFDAVPLRRIGISIFAKMPLVLVGCREPVTATTIVAVVLDNLTFLQTL